MRGCRGVGKNKEKKLQAWTPWKLFRHRGEEKDTTEAQNRKHRRCSGSHRTGGEAPIVPTAPTVSRQLQAAENHKSESLAGEHRHARSCSRQAAEASTAATRDAPRAVAADAAPAAAAAEGAGAGAGLVALSRLCHSGRAGVKPAGAWPGSSGTSGLLNRPVSSGRGGRRLKQAPGYCPLCTGNGAPHHAGASDRLRDACARPRLRSAGAHRRGRRRRGWPAGAGSCRRSTQTASRTAAQRRQTWFAAAAEGRGAEPWAVQDRWRGCARVGVSAPRRPADSQAGNWLSGGSPSLLP